MHDPVGTNIRDALKSLVALRANPRDGLAAHHLSMAIADLRVAEQCLLPADIIGEVGELERQFDAVDCMAIPCRLRIEIDADGVRMTRNGSDVAVGDSLRELLADALVELRKRAAHAERLTREDLQEAAEEIADGGMHCGSIGYLAEIVDRLIASTAVQRLVRAAA